MYNYNNTTQGFPYNNYAPSGYNDNNLNRHRFPSNKYPPRNKLSGSDFGNFEPLSTNQQQFINNNTAITNFNKAFRKMTTLIEKMDYINNSDLIHNNVGDGELNEHIVEYRLNIDSYDRDITVYNNPFEYRVVFNPESSSTLRTERFKNGILVSENIFMHGKPTPHINKEFRNVKYVKLDNIVLPQFGKIIEKNGEFILDPDNNKLNEDRFIMLSIKELESGHHIYCTYDGNTRHDIDPDSSDKFQPPCPWAHILPRKGHGVNGRDFYNGLPFYGSRIYKNSALGNLTGFSIKFHSSFGKPLDYENLFTAEELKKFEDADNPIPRTDIRHPLNYKLQNHISIIIGEVEGQIDTNTKLIK